MAKVNNHTYSKPIGDSLNKTPSGNFFLVGRKLLVPMIYMRLTGSDRREGKGVGKGSHPIQTVIRRRRNRKGAAKPNPQVLPPREVSRASLERGEYTVQPVNYDLIVTFSFHINILLAGANTRTHVCSQQSSHSHTRRTCAFSSIPITRAKWTCLTVSVVHPQSVFISA